MTKNVIKFFTVIFVAATLFVGCQKEQIQDLQSPEVTTQKLLENNAFGYKQVLGDIPLKTNRPRYSYDGPTVYDKAGNAYETFVFNNGIVAQTWIKRNYAHNQVRVLIGGQWYNQNFCSLTAIINRTNDPNGQLYGRYFEYKALNFGVPGKYPIALFRDLDCTIPVNGWRLPTTTDVGNVISEMGGAEYVADPSVLNIQIFGWATLKDGKPLSFSTIGYGDGMFWLTDKPNPNPAPEYNRWLGRISTYYPEYPNPTVFFGGSYDYAPPYTPYRFYANIRLVIDNSNSVIRLRNVVVRFLTLFVLL